MFDLLFAFGDSSLGLTEVAGGGGVAASFILVKVIDNAVRSWTNLNVKRVEFMEAQQASLKETAEHHAAEREYWSWRIGQSSEAAE